MPLAKCPRTGKLFDNSKGMVHPDAQKLEEEDYTRILDYLAEHPNAKPDEVVDKTGVTIECLNRMIKAGRVREMDQHALRQQAEEFSERAAEIAKRNKVASDIGQALRHTPASTPGQHSTSTDVRSTYQNKREKF